jgi:anti-sigma regulatory factor (Ser/Thr protein kinase)
VDVAALVVSELVTNAVEHARTSCRVAVGLGPDRLRISVRDYAPGPSPRPRPVDTDRPGGRGLHLVAMLTTALGVRRHPDGKTVWAVVALPE